MTPPLPPVETGATMPEGVRLFHGECPRCGRIDTDLCYLRIQTPDAVNADTKACAECLHDFAASARAGRMRLYATGTDNQWHEVS